MTVIKLNMTQTFNIQLIPFNILVIRKNICKFMNNIVINNHNNNNMKRFKKTSTRKKWN